MKLLQKKLLFFVFILTIQIMSCKLINAQILQIGTTLDFMLTGEFDGKIVRDKKINRTGNGISSFSYFTLGLKNKLLFDVKFIAARKALNYENTTESDFEFNDYEIIANLALLGRVKHNQATTIGVRESGRRDILGYQEFYSQVGISITGIRRKKIGKLESGVGVGLPVIIIDEYPEPKNYALGSLIGYYTFEKNYGGRLDIVGSFSLVRFNLFAELSKRSWELGIGFGIGFGKINIDSYRKLSK